jgi:hypothetical protein
VDNVINGFLFDYLRPGGAVRGKWRILYGKGESVMVCRNRSYVAQQSSSWMISSLASWLIRRDSVQGTHGLPLEVFAWKTTLG